MRHNHHIPSSSYPTTHAYLATILHDLQPLGLSARRLAALHGFASENTIRQWLAGRVRVPDHVAAWLQSLHTWWLASR
jgi:hypothetical protein